MDTKNDKYVNNGRFKAVPSSYLFLIKNNKILLADRANTGFEDGNYGLVSGHVEENESALEGMVREANEEAGITIKEEDLEVVHVMYRKGSKDIRTDFFFLAKDWQGEPKIMEPDRCNNMNWFSLDNLPANTIDYIRQAIECYQGGIFYSEHGWDK
jgi:ADP-ribose pyrophosphatase YjhB (NUDIX family)